MLVGIEVAKPGDDITGQTDAHDLEDGGKDEEAEIGERWMRIVGVLERAEGEFVRGLGEILVSEGCRRSEGAAMGSHHGREAGD